MKTKSYLYSKNGNVLFMILIAVALFAALSYAVSSSFQGGTNTISEEQARVGAGKILRDMQSIKQGYDYLWNQQGCSMDDISFQSANRNIGTIEFTDEDEDGGPECEIFNPLGAGISYPNNLRTYQDESSAGVLYSNKLMFVFPGSISSSIPHGVINIGTSANDHMIFLTYVKPEICRSLNKLLNYEDFNTDLVDDQYLLGDDETAFEGQTAGCRARAAGGPYDIFYVMQAL